MSKKTNTTLIGLFIVTGVALGVAGLLLFSSSRIFARTREVIVYFDGSLNGLNEGAPVKYRGVQIGSVKRVMVHFNQATNDYAMPVLLELEQELLEKRLGEPTEIFTERLLEERIRSGLRASLQTESLVTGVLYVDMRPNPQAPPPVLHQLVKLYPEVPTEPTQIQALFDNLASVDLKRIETNLNQVLNSLEERVRSLDMAGISQGITNLLVSVDRVVASPEITNAVATLGQTLEEYRLLAGKLNGQVDPLADRLAASLDQAGLALTELRGATEDLRAWLAPDSPLRQELDRALYQVSAAGQSLSTLLDLLKRQPNALITGRDNPDSPP